MDELQRINEAKQTILDSLTSLESQANDKSKTIGKLNEDIETKTTELNGLSEQIVESARTRDTAIEADGTAIEESRGKLNVVLEELKIAEEDLEKVKKGHQQFVAYQAKAEKALRSREEAILKKEKEIEDIIGQTKRRMGILSNVV